MQLITDVEGLRWREVLLFKNQALSASRRAAFSLLREHGRPWKGVSTARLRMPRLRRRGPRSQLPYLRTGDLRRPPYRLEDGARQDALEKFRRHSLRLF